MNSMASEITSLAIIYSVVYQLQIRIQKYFIGHKYKGTYMDKWRI